MNDLEVIELYDNSSDLKRQDFIKNNKTDLKVEHDYELTTIDDSWLKIIEENIRYIDNILRNPNRFIVNEEEVVKVELARRITVDSIKHLSKNTNLIQDIDEDTGDVTPSKVLNINKEESFNTYENRVIYTLIKNLQTYMSIKKQKIGTGTPTKNDKTLSYTGASKIGKEEVNISLTMNSSLHDKDSTNDFIERINKVEMKVKDLTMSPVYKDLNRLHVALVTPPIKKTNLILKNANFQHAMTLWNFLQEEMEDKTEHKKGNEVIKDDEKTKKMLNETFLLNYFILNSFNNDGDIINDDEKIKKNKQVLINQFVQKMVLANEELNFDELGDMVNKEIQLVKEQTLATEKEIKIIFEATIDEYIESINNLKLGDENNENKDK